MELFLYDQEELQTKFKMAKEAVAVQCARSQAQVVVAVFADPRNELSDPAKKVATLPAGFISMNAPRQGSMEDYLKDLDRVFTIKS